MPGDVLDQGADPLLHFTGGAPGERDHHHLAARNTAPDQVRHLVHDRGGLSRARARKNDDVFLRGKSDLLLAGVKDDAFTRNLVHGHGRTGWPGLKNRQERGARREARERGGLERL